MIEKEIIYPFCIENSEIHSKTILKIACLFLPLPLVVFSLLSKMIESKEKKTCRCMIDTIIVYLLFPPTITWFYITKQKNPAVIILQLLSSLENILWRHRYSLTCASVEALMSKRHRQDSTCGL